MGLLDNLEPPKKVWPCRVRDAASELEPKDAKILMDAVMNKDWAYSTLENSLKDRGIQIGQQQIKRHRLGVCSCSKI